MAWLQRLRNAFRGDRVRREIDGEIAFHIAERMDELRSQGLSEEEAARRARVQFGGATAQAEFIRDVDTAQWADGLVRNFRYAVRTLARAPGFTVTVVLTLALGIGANTAVFSALDAVLLRPLPFPEGDRLMRLSEVREKATETTISPVRLEDWNRLNETFEAITGYLTEGVSEISGDLPEKVKRATVAPRFLEVLGVAPALGRTFTAAEHRFGGPSAVLISDRYWRRRFGADPNVLGKTVRIETGSLPIVGVMPASFLFLDRDVDVWQPTLVDAPYAQHRLSTWFNGIARLRPGVTLEQARENLAAVQTQLGRQYPDTDAEIGAKVSPLKEATVGGIRSSLWMLFGAVSVLLLITCTNIAALLLSRGAQREQDVSIRLSLGATRMAVAGQALAEAGVLAFAGATVGVLVALAATSALHRVAADLPRLDEIALDGRILLYTLSSAVAAALLCGALPGIRAARHDLAGALSEAGRRQVSTRNSLQWLLVGAQVALSVMLLAGAGLLVRSFWELSRVNPGFEASRVMTFRLTGSWAETMDLKRLAQRLETTGEALRALPGIEAAATTINLPGVPVEHEAEFALAEGRANAGLRMISEVRSVSPGYFDVMRIPLLDGEECRAQVPRTPRDVVVNQSFATRYLAGHSSAVGLHLKEGDDSSTHRIVGVVGDTRERGLERAPGPTVYWCANWNPIPYFLVRTRGEPLSVAQAVRLEMKELEPLRSVYDIAPLEERIGGAFAEERLRMGLLTVFAMTALSLACVGLYGTLSYVVTLRRREIGLRLTLGAERGGIARQFLLQGLRVSGFACVCGLLLSVVFTRALSRMLYGVSPSDPFTLSGVVAIVLAVASIAALLPAVRAARLAPMRVLREE